MADIIIMNKSTAAKRLLVGLGWCTAALALYYGSQSIGAGIEYASSKYKAHIIESAFESKDFVYAEKILQQYKSTHSLSVEDLVKFEINIKKSKDGEHLDSLLRILDVKQASLFVQQLKDSGLYSSEEIRQKEEAIHPLTEEGLLESIQHADLVEKIEPSKKYLALFSDGQQRDQVIKGLFTATFDYLSQLLEREGNFKDILSTVEAINQWLVKYPHGDLSPIARLEELKAKTTAYLKAVESPTRTDLRMWDRVKITLAEGEIGFIPEYLQERNLAIANGSIGYVVNATVKDGYIVRVDSPTFNSWTKYWDGLRPYWVNGRNNAAYYKRNELQLIGPDDTEKQQLLTGLEKIAAALTPKKE